MTKKEIEKVTFILYEKIIEKYGYSKFHSHLPYLIIEDTPYSDSDVPANLHGEYCFTENEIIIYWKNIPSEKVLIKTLIHEYQHYLQSPTWMTRYYNMGYRYNNHPYELDALKEEKYWRKFV